MKRLAPVILAVAITLSGCTPHQPTTGPALPPQAPPKTPATTQSAAGQTPATQAATPAAPTPPVQAVKPTPTPPALPPAPPVDPIIARVNGVSISRQAVIAPLVQAHGLEMLLKIVELELTKNEAAKLGIVVTEKDVQQERSRTLEDLFRENNLKLIEQIKDAQAQHRDEEAARLQDQLDKDNLSLLEQLLKQQKSSQAEFMIAMESSATLRKIIERQLQGKLTEENVREAFNTIYGENVRVRHIQCDNLQEIAEAQRRLDAGESFESVAEALSRNAQTRALGGELPPFTRETPNLSDSFKQVAFSLKQAGEVSEPVAASGTYHLIKLIERIPPRAEKFEDVKDSVREHLFQRWVQERMKLARIELAQIALQTLVINDPGLAKQFNDRKLKRDAELRDRDQINRELQRQREAATRPAPTTAPNAMPPQEGAVEVPRPPATASGSDTPDQSKATTRP